MNDKQEKGAMQVDVQLVRDLAALLDDTNLTEIEVEDGDRKIRVARTISAAPVVAAVPFRIVRRDTFPISLVSDMVFLPNVLGSVSEKSEACFLVRFFFVLWFILSLRLVWGFTCIKLFSILCAIMIHLINIM